MLPNEIANPRLKVTLWLRHSIVAIGDMGWRISRHRRQQGDSLQFFYDLSVSPLTFDFATFLASAEVERRMKGLEQIDVFLVMRSDGEIRSEAEDYEAVLDKTARLWRIRNVLIPMLALLPSVRSYAVCGTRELASAVIGDDDRQIYPESYRVYLPRQPAQRTIHNHARNNVPIWPLFRATDHSRRLIEQFLDRKARGRRPIVITLRNFDYTPERNSRFEDWLAFADGLDPAVFAPVFVLDAETAMQPPPVDLSRHIVCRAASWNLEIRMALYEAAWLNVSLMHGPLELCWYNENARYLLFLPVGASRVEMPHILAENGVAVGEDLAFAKPWQHIAWCADELPTLRREFEAMMQRLENLTQDAC
jgi:hypothetical protein